MKVLQPGLCKHIILLLLQSLRNGIVLKRSVLWSYLLTSVLLFFFFYSMLICVLTLIPSLY